MLTTTHLDRAGGYNTCAQCPSSSARSVINSGNTNLLTECLSSQQTYPRFQSRSSQPCNNDLNLDYSFFASPTPGPLALQPISFDVLPDTIPYQVEDRLFTAPSRFPSTLYSMTPNCWSRVQAHSLQPPISVQPQASPPDHGFNYIDIVPGPWPAPMPASPDNLEITSTFTQQPQVPTPVCQQRRRSTPLTCNLCPFSRFTRKKDLREHHNTVHLRTRD
ncbi:hypothetical protein QBC43DRAFT_45779 [Cladorrhinum sp. PSN259]|nr:hypothetical protein QBC43DRAFT_45779 [Cladorrhinum sp. PSN259]